MAPSSKSRDGGWACSGCKARNGDGYDFCGKCWKVRGSAKTANHGVASSQDDAEAEDATKAKLKKLRAHLAELRRQAEDPDLAKHAQGNIDVVQKEVVDLQAAVDSGSDIPRCFSECKLKLEQEIKEAQEKLDREKALLARQDEKLQKQSARIEELSVPKPGKGWGAAVSFLEQAKKCLRDQETAKKEADAAAREAAHDKQQRNKRRAAEEIKQELVSFPQNADATQITKIMQEAEQGRGFFTINANSIGTLERTMRSIRYTCKYPIIMAQELQANEHSISCFTQRMQKEGWRLGIAPSVRTARGGWSAGVLLATVRPNNMSYARRLDTWDISPRESKGRLAAILRNFTTAAAAAGKYWILGGDFNMDPAELQRTGVVNRMDGVIAFDTSRGSCVTLGEARRRDYFILSKTLLDGPLHVAVQDQCKTAPHSVVLLRVPRLREEERWVRVLRRQRGWPLQLPTGCVAGPTSWPRLLEHSRRTQEDVDRYWGNLANTYEEHLNKYFNYVGLDWYERKGHLQLPTYAWEQLKPPTVREAAREQQWAEAAEWLGRRLEHVSTAVRAWWKNGKQETLVWAQNNAKGILGKDIIGPLLERNHPAWRAEPDQGRGNDDATDEQDNSDNLDELNYTVRRVEEDMTSLPENTPRRTPAVLGLTASQDCPLVGAEAAGERRRPTGRGRDTDIDWGKLVNTVAWIDAEHITERGLHYVDCVAKLMTVASRHAWRRVRQEAARDWRRWVTRRSQAGAGALHKWTKPPVPWAPIQPTESRTQQELTQPQVAAGTALEGWETVWADSYNADEPWCQAPSDDEWSEHRVPRITPRDVIEACGRFRAGTGLGEADWHPRPWRHGGFSGTARVASVLNAVERGAPWPTSQATILFYLTPKAAGGFRNLGLIPELARVWETIRIPYARRWEAANKRAYDWARRGRSSERAAWLQALYCEAARADGHDYAVTYFDLIKCFEWVTHRKAWQRGIVAGSRYAPFCLKMVIILELDRLVHQFPWADTCLFFDDLAMATYGRHECVDEVHPRFIEAVVIMFETTLDMAVSRGAEGKTATLASSTALGQHINKSTRHLGVRVAKHGKHLGVTATACRRRRVAAINKWALKYAARKARVAAVRRAGGAAHKLIRQAKVPALLYRSSVVGMADSKLTELRKNVAAAMEGNNKGRSTALTLLSDRADPGILANSGPIIAWATAWQEALEDDQLAARLQSAWRTWVMKIYKCKAPWLTVRGPAGAFVATVRRLGWMTQASHTVTIDGNVLDLRYTVLQEIQHHVARATEKQLQDEWLGQHGRQYGITSIFLAPVQALLRRPLQGRWAQAHRTRVGGLFCGGTWPRARLHASGVATDSTCRACGLAPGTDRHRTFVCPVRQPHRDVVGGLHIQQRGANPWPGPGADALWGRGITADPADELGLWELASCDDWLTEGNWDGLATGDIYVDGSLQFGDYAPLRRGGWSFTKLKDNDEYDMDYVCYGPLPGAQWVQSILRAELYALLQALRVGTPPMRIFTDCQNVVDGVMAGPASLDKRSRPHLDLWECIAQAIAELGGLGPRAVQVLKVKAHATRTERAAIGRAQWEGNTIADQYAKQGALYHTHPVWCREAYIHKYRLVRDILEFGAYIGVLGRDIVDAGQGSSPTDSNPPDPPSDLLDLPGNLGAVVGEEGGALAAPDPPAPPLVADLPSRAAVGWARTRVDRAQRAGHKIVTRSTYVFCRRCARYARD
ncbi:unnamed protein product, partial [Prorocentrum cordatum]